MEITWTPAKNARNLRERHFDFAYGAQVFLGEVLEWCDVRQAYGEVRIVAIGLVEETVLLVVYTVRDGKRHIISARPANRKERKLWLELFG